MKKPSTSKKTPSISKSEYLTAAEDLYWAIDHNKSDTAFANRGGEIVYLLDANIVITYLRAEARRNLGAFSLGPFIRDDEDVADLSDRLTVKFLLSGALPGQQGKPAYLSAYHWNETLHQGDVTARKISRENEHAVNNSWFRVRFESLQQAALRGPEDLIVRAQELGFARELRNIDFAASFDTRVRNAFVGRPGLCPRVEGLEKSVYWADAMDARQSHDVRRWSALLTLARKGERHDASVNIASDAKTLATIQALYRENDGSCGPDAEKRFIFVTEDRAIHAAMEERREELEAEGIPSFARHPRVYSPILNFSGMNVDALEDKKQLEELKTVFDKVETAIKALFLFDEGRPRQLPDLRMTTTELARVAADWAASSRDLAPVFSRYFEEDTADLAMVAELFRNFAVFEAVGTRVRERLWRIRGEHAQQTSADAFERLADFLREGKGARNRHGLRRAPVKIIGVDIIHPIADLLPPEWQKPQHQTTLDDLLDRIEGATRGDGKASETITKIANRIVSRRHDPKVQLLASVLYFALSRWDSARACAEHCRFNLKADDRRAPLGREANYCIALADRMQLDTVDDYQSAYQHLTENVGHDTEQKGLAALRDTIEMATLVLTAGVMHVIGDHRFFKNDLDAIIGFTDAIYRLRKARGSIFEQHVGWDGAPADDLTRKLLLQADINLLGAMIYRQLLGEEISKEDGNDGDIRLALIQLETTTVAVDSLPNTARVYMAVARTMLKMPGTSPSTPADEIDSIQAEGEGAQSAGDQVEFTYFRNRYGSGARAA